MTDTTEGALDGASREAVSADQAASEATENTTGQEGAEGADQPADAEAEAKAKAEAEETERKSRNERRREQKERLQREAREAQERARQAEQELQRIRQAAQALPKPKQTDYANFEEYQAALSAHHAVTLMDQREARRIEAEARAEYQRAQEAARLAAQEDARHWAAQMQEARSRYADFDKVALQDAPVDERMARVIVQSDIAADVAYYLGKHPEEGRRIAALDDLGMARAIGRIEASLLNPKPVPVTSAPPPITPGRANAAPIKDPARMTPAEYRAWREKGGIPT